MTVVARDHAYKPDEDDLSVPVTKEEFNVQTRDLNISKEFA